jgi:hypothetical protein
LFTLSPEELLRVPQVRSWNLGLSFSSAYPCPTRIIPEWIETAKQLGRPIPSPRGRLAFA